MARISANRRRRMNQNLRPITRSGTITGRGDWVISDQGASASGASVTVHGWNTAPATTAQTLTTGSPISLLLVALPTAAAATGQPTIGNVEIAQIHGKVGFLHPSAAGSYMLGCAIYIAELNSSSTTWSVRDPLVESDANRDDYLFLDTVLVGLPTFSGFTAAVPLEFRLSIPRPVVIGGGQALCCTLSMLGAAATTIDSFFTVRSLVRRAT